MRSMLLQMAAGWPAGSTLHAVTARRCTSLAQLGPLSIMRLALDTAHPPSLASSDTAQRSAAQRAHSTAGPALTAGRAAARARAPRCSRFHGDRLRRKICLPWLCNALPAAAPVQTCGGCGGGRTKQVGARGRQHPGLTDAQPASVAVCSASNQKAVELCRRGAGRMSCTLRCAVLCCAALYSPCQRANHSRHIVSRHDFAQAYVAKLCSAVPAVGDRSGWV